MLCVSGSGNALTSPALRDGFFFVRSVATPVFCAIEVNDRSIAIDGVAATGPSYAADWERMRMSYRLSYLDADAGRQLLGSPTAPATDRSVGPVRRQEQSSDNERRRPNASRGAIATATIASGSEETCRSGSEVITGDLVSIGGSARVNGEVQETRSRLVAASNGPRECQGDAVSVGGALKRDPGGAR
jgi:hypothetical protein